VARGAAQVPLPRLQVPVPRHGRDADAPLGGSDKTAWFLEHRIRTALPRARAADVVNLAPGRAHHRTSAGYRNAYLAEASWRAARRNPTHRFRATVQALLEAEPLSYDELIKPVRRSTRL
jgi:hypothetical protein